jgi:hypothetical protein
MIVEILIVRVVHIFPMSEVVIVKGHRMFSTGQPRNPMMNLLGFPTGTAFGDGGLGTALLRKSSQPLTFLPIGLLILKAIFIACPSASASKSN